MMEERVALQQVSSSNLSTRKGLYILTSASFRWWGNRKSVAGVTIHVLRIVKIYLHRDKVLSSKVNLKICSVDEDDFNSL